jgi:hypothetical protein
MINDICGETRGFACCLIHGSGLAWDPKLTPMLATLTPKVDIAITRRNKFSDMNKNIHRD